MREGRKLKLVITLRVSEAEAPCASSASPGSLRLPESPGSPAPVRASARRLQGISSLRWSSGVSVVESGRCCKNSSGASTSCSNGDLELDDFWRWLPIDPETCLGLFMKMLAGLGWRGSCREPCCNSTLPKPFTFPSTLPELHNAPALRSCRLGS